MLFNDTKRRRMGGIGGYQCWSFYSSFCLAHFLIWLGCFIFLGDFLVHFLEHSYDHAHDHCRDEGGSSAICFPFSVPSPTNDIFCNCTFCVSWNTSTSELGPWVDVLWTHLRVTGLQRVWSNHYGQCKRENPAHSSRAHDYSIPSFGVGWKVTGESSTAGSMHDAY